MDVRVLTVLLAWPLFAASDRPLTLLERSQFDFDRVALAAQPALGSATACIQTQASLLSVSGMAEIAVVDYHKGYCEMAAAALTGDAEQFRAAAADFDKALDWWPSRSAVLAKRKQPAEPAPSMLRVLSQLARLKAADGHPGTDKPAAALAAALDGSTCPSAWLPGSLCADYLSAGREWQGWLALGDNDFDGAARAFSAASASGWSAWAAGKQAFRAGQYSAASAAYGRAVSAWEAAHAEPVQPLSARMAPPEDLPGAYTELGGARLLAGDAAGALAALQVAVRRAPTNSHALYLRGRAEEASGRMDAALADYNLASRTAFANSDGLASGEAHLYRGILLFRRKQYRSAEDEFSSALNFSIAPSMRADAVAWRRLSAVAEGSCEVGPRYLEEALPAASPFFPRQEARDFLAACDGPSPRSRLNPPATPR